MARHYRGFCLSTQVAIFPLSRAPQRSNNGASFNLTGNASVEFWRCDQLIREHTQDYIRYLSRGIVYQLRVRLRLKLQHAFGETYCRLSSIRRSKSCLENCESPRPVHRCPWRLRYLIRYRMLPFSPTRRRPSLRVLSPPSRPALGLTSLLADTHHVDDSIKMSGRKRKTT